MIYLVDVASGGYDDDQGWTGEANHKPTPHPRAEGDNKSYWQDPETFARSWQTIAIHTESVTEATRAITTALALDAKSTAALRMALFGTMSARPTSNFRRPYATARISP